MFLRFILPLVTAVALQAATPPNILVIYTDDHGWADLGAQGVDKDIRTPNIDRLAADGVRFARGYVSAPQCVPSRAGVLTGRYQQKFGVEDNNKGPLPLEEITIAERLKKAGYVTDQVGKWHLDVGGDKKAGKAARMLPDHLPHAQGFDEYWCGTLRQFHASHDLQSKPFPDAPHVVTDARFRIVVQTEAALSFLDRRSARPDQPWFLYLAWFAPHVPLESPEPWFSRTPATLPKERRQALAMIAGMDDGLGRIRAKLKDMGVSEKTLIFFISDNGAPIKEGAWDGSLNLPLIGEKGMLTDGGIRTPFLAAWPGTLPAGLVYQHPVSSLDVASTAVGLAGLKRDDRLDGVDLMPFLTGKNKGAPHDTLFWRWRSQAAVLEFPWKLIQLGEKGRYLFDVTTPEGELKNRIAEHPEIAARLEAKLKTWSATLKPPGPPEPGNDQDNMFFAAHVDKTLEHAVKRRTAGKAAPSGSVQGWLCRNGTLELKDGALVVTPEEKARGGAFITLNGIDLTGPVTAKLRVRGKAGGKGSFSWRTQTEKDFLPEHTSSTDWAAGTDWHDIEATIPVQGKLIHIRISPPRGGPVEIQSIALQGHKGEPQVFRFNAAK